MLTDFGAWCLIMPVQVMKITVWYSLSTTFESIYTQQVHIEWDTVRLLNQSSLKMNDLFNLQEKNPFSTQSWRKTSSLSFKDLVNWSTNGSELASNFPSWWFAKRQTWCVVHEPSALREQIPLDLIAASKNSCNEMDSARYMKRCLHWNGSSCLNFWLSLKTHVQK